MEVFHLIFAQVDLIRLVKYAQKFVATEVSKVQQYQHLFISQQIANKTYS